MKRDSVYQMVTYDASNEEYHLNKYVNNDDSTLEGYITHFSNGNFGFTSGGHAGGTESPMSIDDQRWLDKCIEAGKLVPREEGGVKEPPSKFKVGDRVMYDGAEATIVENKEDGTYHIERFDGGGWVSTTFGNGKYWFVTEDELSPITVQKPSVPIPAIDNGPSALTNDELLQIAKTRYPIGTVFKDLNEGSVVTVVENWYSPGQTKYEMGWIGGEPYILVYTDQLFRYILLSDKWAEILEPAKTAQVEVDSVPTPYIPTTNKPNLTNEVKVYDEHGAPKLKIPEGVYGKFGDPLKSTAKDVSWSKGGVYVAAVDPYNPSKSWYEREQRREQERIETLLKPFYFHEGSKENRIFIDGTETKKSLDTYIQQPIIIKKSHKQKTLKIV